MVEGNSSESKDRRVMIERRATHTLYPCPLHDLFVAGLEKDLATGEKRMERFEQKIDSILAWQVKQNLEQQAMKMFIDNALSNGLSKDIREVRDCMESIEGRFIVAQDGYAKKFAEFDDFRWFRDWANGLKNKGISWILSLIVLGGLAMSAFLGIIYLVLHMARKI
jgi:hypothetical protein